MSINREAAASCRLDGETQSHPYIAVTLQPPPKELRPNGRYHWAAKAKAVKSYRNAAHGAALFAMSERMNAAPFHWPKANVYPTVYVKDRRGLKQDGDNVIASLKAAGDGLADAGVVANDRLFVWHAPVFAIDKANPRVELVIERIER